MFLKYCERKKNLTLFMDEANCLNQYLLYHPEVFECLVVKIEDFI